MAYNSSEFSLFPVGRMPSLAESMRMLSKSSARVSSKPISCKPLSGFPMNEKVKEESSSSMKYWRVASVRASLGNLSVSWRILPKACTKDSKTILSFSSGRLLQSLPKKSAISCRKSDPSLESLGKVAPSADSSSAGRRKMRFLAVSPSMKAVCDSLEKSELRMMPLWTMASTSR